MPRRADHADAALRVVDELESHGRRDDAISRHAGLRGKLAMTSSASRAGQRRRSGCRNLEFSAADDRDLRLSERVGHHLFDVRAASTRFRHAVALCSG